MKNILLLLFLLMSVRGIAQQDGWHISTSSTKNYNGIVVANGRLGILSDVKPLQVKQVILNNVYDRESSHGVSKILLGMNFGNLEMEIDGEKISQDNISDWQQTLNMKEAGFNTSFNFKKKAFVSYTIYALRNVPYSAYIDIKVEAKQNIKVKVTGKIETPLEYQNPHAIARHGDDFSSFEADHD